MSILPLFIWIYNSNDFYRICKQFQIVISIGLLKQQSSVNHWIIVMPRLFIIKQAKNRCCLKSRIFQDLNKNLWFIVRLTLSPKHFNVTAFSNVMSRDIWILGGKIGNKTKNSLSDGPFIRLRRYFILCCYGRVYSKTSLREVNIRYPVH